MRRSVCGENMWGESFYVFFRLKKKNQCHQPRSDPKITKQSYVCARTQKGKLWGRKRSEVSSFQGSILNDSKEKKKCCKSDEKYPSSILSESHLTSGGFRLCNIISAAFEICGRPRCYLCSQYSASSAPLGLREDRSFQKRLVMAHL